MISLKPWTADVSIRRIYFVYNSSLYCTYVRGYTVRYVLTVECGLHIGS